MGGSGFCGLDVGACATKAVIADADGRVLGRAVERSGLDFEAAADAALKSALLAAGTSRESLVRTVATGYGRKNAPGARAHKTELACHARGCYHHFPSAITVVDIGGQDNKIIHVAADGTSDSFKMNRKCAAGTGAFIEEIASRLGLPLSGLNALARQSSSAEALGSFCTVFAQTEILAKMRRGVGVADIVRGAFRSVVQRILEMDPLEGEVVLTGGVVAHNPVLVELFAGQAAGQVRLPPDPQCAGAFGAALFARDLR